MKLHFLSSANACCPLNVVKCVDTEEINASHYSCHRLLNFLSQSHSTSASISLSFSCRDRYLKGEDFLGHYFVSVAVIPLNLSFGTLAGQRTNAK